jgi:hypothetical protein
LGRPETYRAGTVPPVVHVGMVLRGPYGQVRTVSDVDEDVWLMWTDEPWRAACRYSAVDLADWSLARDFTESCADIEERNK